jgi:hypothetical protein
MYKWTSDIRTSDIRTLAYRDTPKHVPAKVVLCYPRLLIRTPKCLSVSLYPRFTVYYYCCRGWTNVEDITCTLCTYVLIPCASVDVYLSRALYPTVPAQCDYDFSPTVPLQYVYDLCPTVPLQCDDDFSFTVPLQFVYDFSFTVPLQCDYDFSPTVSLQCIYGSIGTLLSICISLIVPPSAHHLNSFYCTTLRDWLLISEIVLILLTQWDLSGFDFWS